MLVLQFYGALNDMVMMRNRDSKLIRNALIVEDDMDDRNHVGEADGQVAKCPWAGSG